MKKKTLKSTSTFVDPFAFAAYLSHPPPTQPNDEKTMRRKNENNKVATIHQQWTIQN